MTTLNQTMMMILTTIRSEATKAAHSWLAYSRRPTTRRRCRRLMRKAMLLGLACFFAVSLSVEKEVKAAYPVDARFEVEKEYQLEELKKYMVSYQEYVGDGSTKSDRLYIKEHFIQGFDGSEIVFVTFKFYIKPLTIDDTADSIKLYSVDSQGNKKLRKTFYSRDMVIDDEYSDGRSKAIRYGIQLDSMSHKLYFQLETRKSGNIYDVYGLGGAYVSIVENSTTPTASIQTPTIQDQTANISYTASDTTDATIGVYDSLGSLVGTTQSIIADGTNQSVTFADLPAGVYTASIKDGDGTVLATSETFTIANPDATATITLNSDYFGEEENIAVTYQADNIKNGSISLFDKLDNEVTSSQIITADNTTQTVTFQPLSPATYTAKINAVDLNDQTVIFASRPFTVTPQATSTIKLLNQPIYQGQHIIVEYTAENLSSGKMGLYTGIHLIGSDQDVVADGTPHTVTLQSLVAGEYEVRLTGQDLRGEEVTFSSPVTVTVPPPTETPTPTATPTETPTPTATPTETATATPTPVLVLQPPPPAEGYTLLMSGVLTVTGQMEARQSCQWSVDGTPLSITGCTVVLSGPDYAAGEHDLSLNMAGQSQSTTFTVVDDRQRVFLPLLMR